MLSFEQKITIFRSFQELEEKPISNNKLNYIYPDSLQRGKMLSTQLQPSGNGYVIGKYMDEETIHSKGYIVDSRGWINIKEFSSEDLHEVISTAMMSMSGKSIKNHSNVLHVKQQTMVENEKPETKTKPIIEGWVSSYVNNWLGLGIINPILFKEHRTEVSKIQTNTFDQSLELVQNVANIWMSAMFGKMGRKN